MTVDTGSLTTILDEFLSVFRLGRGDVSVSDFGGGFEFQPPNGAWLVFRMRARFRTFCEWR